MENKIYLYDADGSDKEIGFADVSLEKLNDKQLVWINLLQREEEIISQAVSALKMKNVPCKSILNVSERPKIDKFDSFYRFFIISVKMNEDGRIERIPIDFLVGKNYIVTIHQGEVDYFEEFREREKGETQIGRLDAESFVATLLDLHIVSYFRVLEEIERRVDRFDNRILKRDLNDDEFLREMVGLRSDVSKLRRWFLPHRDVFYALSRPDFRQISESDSKDFEMLNQHFENAVDSIESSRDTVLSLFDLFATKNAHQMNYTIRRLTFVTLLVGGLGTLAGIWGMNFEVVYFKSAETGFWMTIAAMAVLSLGLTVFAWFRRWL